MLTGNELVHPQIHSTTTNENLLSEVYSENGLTIRQHFASLTFAAIISSPIDYGMNLDMLAKKAVNATDILIAELNKEK